MAGPCYCCVFGFVHPARCAAAKPRSFADGPTDTSTGVAPGCHAFCAGV